MSTQANPQPAATTTDGDKPLTFHYVSRSTFLTLCGQSLPPRHQILPGSSKARRRRPVLCVVCEASHLLRSNGGAS